MLAVTGYLLKRLRKLRDMTYMEQPSVIMLFITEAQEVLANIKY